MLKRKGLNIYAFFCLLNIITPTNIYYIKEKSILNKNKTKLYFY